MYRSQLVNGLFAEMEEALEEYTGTPAYAQRVADALARRAPEISGKCTVRLRRADEALLAPVVKKALPSADIAVDGSIRLGGVKLETQHILYDETLDFAAAAERAAFFDALQAAGGVTRAASIRARRRANEYGPLPEKPFFQAFFPDGLELGASL